MGNGRHALRKRRRIRVAVGVGVPIVLLAAGAVVDTMGRAPETTATANAAYGVQFHRHGLPERRATPRSDDSVRGRSSSAPAPGHEAGGTTLEATPQGPAGQPSASARTASPRTADAGSRATRSATPSSGPVGAAGGAQLAQPLSPQKTPARQPAPAASTGGASVAGGSGPSGVSGRWGLVFDDEFTGTSLDRTRWSDMNAGNMNGVTTRSTNVSVSGGNLILRLSSASDGAEVSSSPGDGAGANGYLLQVGDYAEARIDFPGDGNRLYNWPAWWSSGPNWPAAGENDIAEILDGELTVNYHSTSGAHNQGSVPGYWGNAYHVYGLSLQRGHADVYWDGTLVKSYPTDDNGQGQSLLLNIGRGGHAVTGAASQVKVDWVRAYRPAQ